MSDYQLLCGDAVQVLKTLPSGSVQCCVTSPPYYGLRSYLPDDHPDKEYELGAEETPEAYVSRMVEVFREVRRVLHPSGVAFINIGDSYASSSKGSGGPSDKQLSNAGSRYEPMHFDLELAGLKPKDLIGIPWMLAFALRADGWWLRQEIIWHKLAPMPESVTDRCTKAHEQVFLLAKSREYFYDAEAIREPFSMSSWTAESDAQGETRRGAEGIRSGEKGHARANGAADGTRYGATSFQNGGYTQAGRNKRSVWTLGPEQYSGSHYAVMPTKLVEPCVLAGTSAKGCCAQCGSPWERVVEREPEPDGLRNRNGGAKMDFHTRQVGSGQKLQDWKDAHPPQTIGWQPTCTCNADIAPCTVLDPFFGSGTVGAVALKHGRRFVGIDLDERNLALAHKRIGQSQPMLFSEVL